MKVARLNQQYVIIVKSKECIMRTSLLMMLLLIVSASSLACDKSGVNFDASFESARLDGCKQLKDGSFELLFKPEDRPINSSAWYAFKVSSDTPQTIQLRLTFDGFLPRYLPKLSTDGAYWQNLPFDVDKKGFDITVPVSNEPVWIAAQELINNAFYPLWLKQLNDNTKGDGQVKFIELAKSTDKRPIHALANLTKGGEWVVLIGRQHPPEITGALAMIPFVETIFSDTKRAKAFRKRFNVLVVPNLNPDGVAEGNWRHDTNGQDLNRDWGKFTQEETRAVKNFIESLVKKGHKLVFAVDFHSTTENVFYTLPESSGVRPKKLVKNWLADINKVAKRIFKVRNKPGNSPGKGVFKQYIADTYKVHGVTFEVGDNTNREVIRNIGKLSANTMMDNLLDTPAKDF